MGRFDFVSPGAAVSDTVGKILADQRAEQRQALLDQLSQNADQRATESAIEEHAQRQFQQQNLEDEMKTRQQDRDIQNLNAFTSGMKMGDDPEAMGADPDLLKLGVKYGKFTPVKQDAISVPGQTPSKAKYAFAGSDKERQHKEEQVRSGNMIATMMNSSDPDTRNQGTMLGQLVQATDGVITPEMFQMAGMIKKPVIGINKETGGIKNYGNFASNADVTQYDPYHRPRNFFQAGTDDNDNPVYIDQDKVPVGPDGVAKLPPGIHAKGKTGNVVQDQLHIPPKIYDNFSTSMKMFQGALGKDDNGQITTVNDPNVLAAYRTDAHAAVGSSSASNKVKYLVNIAIESPMGYKRKLLQMQQSGDTLTQAEVGQLATMIGEFVPTPLHPALDANPFGGK